MFKNLILIGCTAFLLNGCFGKKKEEKWTAFIYPNKEDVKKNIKSPMTFGSLEECKQTSILEIKNQKLEKIAFFKCGLNCTYHEGMKVEVCEEMLSSVNK
jgi:hypothetical protein